MINISSKTEKVAESPLKFNLQLFADGEPVEPVEQSEPIEPTEPVEPSEPVEPTEPPEVVDPEPVIQKQDHKTNKAFQEMRKQIQEVESFAKSLGYNSFAELQMAQQQQAYVNQGIDPVIAQKLAQMDSIAMQAAERENRARIAEEKALLKDKPYFKDLESEVDELLSVNPQLSVEAVFDFLKGKNLGKLVSKEKEATKQKTLNNINSKQHLKTEGDGASDADDVHVPEDTLQMYLDMGMSKKEAYAHYKKLYGR